MLALSWSLCSLSVCLVASSDDRYRTETVVLSGNALLSFIELMNPKLVVVSNGNSVTYSHVASSTTAVDTFGDVVIPNNSAKLTYSLNVGSYSSITYSMSRLPFDGVIKLSFDSFVYGMTSSSSSFQLYGTSLSIYSGDIQDTTVHYSSSKSKTGSLYAGMYFNYFDLTGGNPVNITLSDPSNLVINSSMGLGNVKSMPLFEFIISPVTITSAKYVIDEILEELGNIDDTLKDIEQAIIDGTIKIEDAIDQGVQDIIDNQDKNTHDIIDNQDKNTQEIIDNDNKNHQEQLDHDQQLWNDTYDPSDGDVSDLQQSIQDEVSDFEDKLGIFSFVDDTLQQFVDCFAYEGDGYPIFDIPEVGFDMGGDHLVLIQAQTVDWADYLDNDFGNVLVAACKFFISFICILGFINYLKTKYERIFGGVSGD